MNVEYINPFVEASQGILKQIIDVDIKLGKIYVKSSTYSSDEVLIIIGLTGVIKGQTVLSFNHDFACKVAQAFMGELFTGTLDDMAKSALSELGNMIMGNAATIFSTKGHFIDITPPTILMGTNMQFSINKEMMTVSIPLMVGEGYTMEIDVSFKENK